MLPGQVIMKLSLQDKLNSKSKYFRTFLKGLISKSKYFRTYLKGKTSEVTILTLPLQQPGIDNIACNKYLGQELKVPLQPNFLSVLHPEISLKTSLP